ncbi:hypothetical protein JOC73_000311 [Alkaliphilus hydrothermalis]|uniref:Uncharacterized protein n=1 Tax=Alkaliphilus hydrothermalis TaxID=1482730 RepID=A0ABS2NLK1_9FIRM|nr:hypothetical protein [Alkaliphilus hydrothermalis]
MTKNKGQSSKIMHLILPVLGLVFFLQPISLLKEDFDLDIGDNNCLGNSGISTLFTIYDKK